MKKSILGKRYLIVILTLFLMLFAISSVSAYENSSDLASVVSDDSSVSTVSVSDLNNLNSDYSVSSNGNLDGSNQIASSDSISGSTTDSDVATSSNAGSDNTISSSSDSNSENIATSKFSDDVSTYTQSNDLVIMDEVSSYSAPDNTYYVGVNKTVDGSGTLNDPFANIQLALNHTADNGHIIIQEGNYSGTGNVNITINITNLTINAEENANVFFDGNNTYRIFLVETNATNLTIKGITFIRANDTSKMAAAIYWKADNGTLDNCTFIANNASTGGYGGAVDIWGNFSLINNCQFYDNIGRWGGALGVCGNNVTLLNSLFRNNTASYSGGAIRWGHNSDDGINGTILNVTIDTNHAIGHGGAICLYGRYLYMANSTVINCTSVYSGGVHMHTVDNVIDNCLFVNNSATSYGGAISIVQDNGNDTAIAGNSIINCNFTNNTANSYGAGIEILGNNAFIANCTMLNNSAQNGAGIHIAGSNAIVDNTVIINNTANSTGAGVWIVGSNTTISNSNIVNNTAGLNGAGVYIQGSFASINGSVIESNFASNGAGVYINGLNATIENSEITSNNASVNGGGAYISGFNAVINNVNFTKNNAIPSANNLTDGLGGAFYVFGNNAFVNNSLFEYNTARNGSAIYTDGKGMQVNGTTFHDNQAWIYWIPSDYNDSDIYSILYGGNNILNAIYNNADFTDIWIDGANPVNGAENSLNGTIPYQDGRENNQTIQTVVYDKYGNLVYNGTRITDLYGNVNYPFTVETDMWYIVHMTHLEDTYYKSITNITALNVNSGLNIEDVTMYEGDPTPQSIYAVLADNNKHVIPGASTVQFYVKVNGTYVYLGSLMTDGNGLAIFNESTIFKTLSSGKYELFANYTNDDHKFEVCNISGNLTVLPLYYHVNKTVINGDKLSVGDIVEFNISVVNDGNATIHNIITIDLNMPGLEAIINESYPNWEYIGNNSWIYSGNLTAYNNISFIPKFLITSVGNLTNVATVIVNNGTGSNKTNVTFIVKLATNITIDNPVISGHGDDTVTTNCTVIDENGEPVKSGSVDLIVNGIVVGTGTVVDGHVSINWIIPNLKPGDYNIIAVYLGDDNYYPSSTHNETVLVNGTNQTMDGNLTVLKKTPVNPKPSNPSNNHNSIGSEYNTYDSSNSYGLNSQGNGDSGLAMEHTGNPLAMLLLALLVLFVARIKPKF